MTIKTVNDEYIPGNYLMTCDRCGLRFRRSELKRDGFIKGLMVCRTCWDFKPVFPSPPPDRHAVPIPRPEQGIQASGIAYTITTIGLNLFPDPFISPDNDNLWSSGSNTQQFVKAEYYSKMLASETAEITVSGLEIGQTYRIRCSAWTSDTASVLIDSVDSGLFSSITSLSWNTDIVYWVADVESAVFSFVGSSNITYYDDIHIQSYDEEEANLTPAQIIINTTPEDVTIDNTVEGEIINFFSFADHPDSNSLGFADMADVGGGGIIKPVVGLEDVAYLSIRCIDNWNNGLWVGLRTIELYDSSGKIDTSEYSLSQFGQTTTQGQPHGTNNAFNFLSKTGSDEYNTWLSAAGTITNQILTVALSSSKSITKIVINNYHYNGGSTDRGTKNMSIYVSTEEAFSTVWSDPLPSDAMLVFSGQLPAHVTGDIADDQIVYEV